MPLLDVQGLEKWYGRRKVVDGVSFDVNPGEIVGLLGPNGAGKTTSFRMTTGQVAPNGGTVQFAERDVTHYPMYRRARLGMGYLSQEQSIFRKLTVEKNLLAILEALPRSRSLGRKLNSRERHERAEAALERFNLTHVRNNVAARCSGGEKRRLEIARCLVCEPSLILLDEPFAAVDPKTTEDIRNNIRDLADTGIGILLTDHNVREVVKTADRIYLIVEGKVVCHGTPEELIRDPIAIDAYLGTTFQDDVLMARVAGFKSSDVSPVLPATPPAEKREPEPMELSVAPGPMPEAAEPMPDSSIPVRVDAPMPIPKLPPAPIPEAKPAPRPNSPIQVDDRVPLSVPMPARPVEKLPPTPSPQFSNRTQQLLDEEKMRRAIDQLPDRERMPDAWHDLASRGEAAIPVLLESLERREVEIRHLSHRLLEAITGESLAYQSDANEDVRLRQTAHLRVKFEKRK